MASGFYPYLSSIHSKEEFEDMQLMSDTKLSSTHSTMDGKTKPQSEKSR
jgi:hypothetical protein